MKPARTTIPQHSVGCHMDSNEYNLLPASIQYVCIGGKRSVQRVEGKLRRDSDDG